VVESSLCHIWNGVEIGRFLKALSLTLKALHCLLGVRY